MMEVVQNLKKVQASGVPHVWYPPKTLHPPALGCLKPKVEKNSSVPLARKGGDGCTFATLLLLVFRACATKQLTTAVSEWKTATGRQVHT